MKKTLIPRAILFLTSVLVFGQNKPDIPDGEVIRYKTLLGRRGEEVEYSSQSIYRITEENQEYYLLKSRSPGQSTETKISIDSFIPIAMNKTVYGERSDINTSISLLTEPYLSPDEIALIDTNDMANVLRAYPFDTPRDMTLIFLGQGGNEMNDMSFRIIFRGEETISLNNREYKAWKLELKAELDGAMAFFASMIPKTYLWFSREDSRHLLKMTGSRGPGAENAITLEMISYTR